MNCCVNLILLIIINISSQNDDRFRLPKTVVPLHYKLQILTILEDSFVQRSSVDIHIKCTEPTNIVTLHSRNLTIREIRLDDQQSSQSLQLTHEFQPEFDFLHIHLNKKLESNSSYVLKIKFTGEIVNGMSGYYRSSYVDESGRRRWLGTTYFEPTNARAAFPCFDEPALRAVFDIVLGRRHDLVALSNMPKKSTRPISFKKGWVWDVFESTPKMSTYLVAFTISDFSFHTTKKSNRFGTTTLNVWAPNKTLKQVEYAAEITPKILAFFEDYFNIAYPLPKSDLVAVPDFSMGAMENWGLIIFRESKLLFVPGVSSEDDKYTIASIIAHEVAHYWFGNLVTIKWWTYLWLKEGFATYLAMMAADELFPRWKSYATKTVINNMQAVYSVDGVAKSRPVSIPIKDPNTITEIFDSITYSKGSCIIRMMYLFLGKDVMRKGLSQYLKKFAYSATEKDDLWNSLSEAAHEENALQKDLSINTIMNTWTQQIGYPLVTVVRDYTKRTVTVTQARFFEDITKKSGTCFWVPLSYTTEQESDFDNTKPKRWLPCPKQKVVISVRDSGSWVLFNIQAAGFYIVNYDEKNWRLLINQLEHDYRKIALLNRVVLIDDVMRLAMRGYLDFKISFDLVGYIRHEDSYEPWKIALNHLNKLIIYLSLTSHNELINKYVLNLTKPIYDSFGGIKNPKITSPIQNLIISSACSTGIQDCVRTAVDMFNQWLKSNGSFEIPRRIQKLVFCQGIEHGDETSWDFLWRQYLKSNVANEKVKILAALGCTHQQRLLARLLQRMITRDSGIRFQDVQAVFIAAITNKKGSDITRSFFYKHIKEIYETMSPPGSQMRYFLPFVERSLRTTSDFNKFRKFMKENSYYFKMAHITMMEMLEKVDVKEKWYKKILPKVIKALEEMKF